MTWISFSGLYRGGVVEASANSTLISRRCAPFQTVNVVRRDDRTKWLLALVVFLANGDFQWQFVRPAVRHRFQGNRLIKTTEF